MMPPESRTLNGTWFALNHWRESSVGKLALNLHIVTDNIQVNDLAITPWVGDLCTHGREYI